MEMKKKILLPCHYLYVGDNLSLSLILSSIYFHHQKKCEKYWPDLQLEATFGKFKVLLLTENHYAFYTVRRMKVTFLEVKLFSVISFVYFYKLELRRENVCGKFRIDK